MGCTGGPRQLRLSKAEYHYNKTAQVKKAEMRKEVNYKLDRGKAL